MKIASFCRSAACLGLVLLAELAVAPAWSAERGPLRRAPWVEPVETEARVIVKFKADSSMMRALAASPNAARPMQAQALSARLGLEMRDGHALGPRTQVLTAKGIGSRELAARLSAQSDVEYAEVDERMRAFAAPNDPRYLTSPSPLAGQWYLRAPNATLVSAVNAEAAWDITTGRSAVVVAVLDTGVRGDHPDLAGKLLPGYDFISVAATANDGDGRDSDPSDPGDWVEAADVGVAGCTSADIGPSSWHGTQTAGLVGAATNNGIGMAGIGRDVRVLPLRVLGKCGGLSSDIQSAMRWAAGLSAENGLVNPNPAKVINLSLGGPATGPGAACGKTYQDVVNELIAAGVVVVAAAGNEGLTVGSPANCSGVIGVTGVRHTGTKVGYSNLGDKASISAPAGNCFNSAGACLYPLLTTSNSGSQGPVANTYTDGINDPTLGTSFSAPLVAGTAALMISANPSLTPAHVLAALKSTARSFPATGAAAGVRACTIPTSTAQNNECYCTTSTCGAGLLDAGAAVAAVGRLWATINVAPAYPLAGRTIALAGSASTVTGSAAAAAYSWQILSGDAAFSGPVDQSNATVIPSAAGSVVVRLTVTDGLGRSAVSATTLSVSGAPVAAIAVTPTSPTAGQTVALDGSSSETGPTGSLTISNYMWTITGGGGSASFVGATNAATASLLTSAAGNLTVTLTVTDSASQQSTTSRLITVGAGPATPAPPVPASSSGGGGGGGALNLEWLLTLIASTLALSLASRRQRRAARLR